VISIPAIRDRVVQGALHLIVEPILEADFSDSPFGVRPGRSAHEAIEKVQDCAAADTASSLSISRATTTTSGTTGC
jgi:retron-type reverse transcriptase